MQDRQPDMQQMAMRRCRELEHQSSGLVFWLMLQNSKGESEAGFSFPRAVRAEFRIELADSLGYAW